MTRNQKIALGCGGAGCLGLIVVVIAGLIFYFAIGSYNLYGLGNNADSNRNDNTAISNDNDNDNSSSSSSSSSSSAASSLSDDDKHKLYHAAMVTGDPAVLQRVSVKLGLMNEDYTPGADYEEFVTDHVTWVISNGSFIQSINSEEKAREYLNNNLPE